MLLQWWCELSADVILVTNLQLVLDDVESDHRAVHQRQKAVTDGEQREEEEVRVLSPAQHLKWVNSAEKLQDTVTCKWT